nr:MAG TPA: hypothetical protein [Caudoviricetes sp.]
MYRFSMLDSTKGILNIQISVLSVRAFIWLL